MDRCVVNGKCVYVVENHKDVLSAWAETRRGLVSAPLLITLDYHTDTVEAFHQWAVQNAGSDTDARTRIIDQCIKSIDYDDDGSVSAATSLIQNNEQVDAAIRSGIVDIAVVLAHSSNPQTPPVEVARFCKNNPFANYLGCVPPDGPYTYEVPEGRIFNVDLGCYVGCTKATHDQDCIQPRRDQAIESPFLLRALETANIMCKTSTGIAIHERDYVVDIDLDYFCTAKSIRPDDTSAFYRLLSGAVAVTIATEPDFVESCRLDGEDIAADHLLREMMNHLRLAIEQDRDENLSP